MIRDVVIYNTSAFVAISNNLLDNEYDRINLR